MLIDSHAHLGDERLFLRVDEVLQKAHHENVKIIVDICTDSTTLSRGLLLQEKTSSPEILLAAATTPHDVAKEEEAFFSMIEECINKKQLVAIGETGLDYYYEHSPKDLQKKHLIRYFHLAKRSQLPVIFHCRDAFDDLFAFADAEYQSPSAVVHCFTGTIEEAKKTLDRGWNISFSGIVTFTKSKQLQEVAKYVPLDRIFLETDAPYLAPQSQRGKCNEPAFIAETAKMIATLKNIELEEVIQKTFTNAYEFFMHQEEQGNP